MSKLKEDVAKALEKLNSTELVSDSSFDRDTKMLSFNYNGEDVLLIVPDRYPKGEYQLSYSGGSSEIRGGDKELSEILDQVIKGIEEKQNGDGAEWTMEEEEEDDLHSGSYSQSQVDSQFLSEDVGSCLRIGSEIEEELKELNATPGWHGRLTTCSPAHIVVWLHVHPSRFKQKDIVLICWGIDPKRYVSFKLEFSSPDMTSLPQPKVTVSQSGSTESDAMPMTDSPCRFRLDWTLEKRIELEFLKSHPADRYAFPMLKRGNFYREMLSFSERHIANCTAVCVMCGNTLPYVTVKPAVCDDQLCIFKHETFGFGIDVATEIMHHGDVVDFMITMAAAAADAGRVAGRGYAVAPRASSSEAQMSDFYLDPFPIGIEVKTRAVDEETMVMKAIEVHSFAAEGKDRFNVMRVRDVIEKIPPILTLQESAAQGTDALKSYLDGVDPLAFPLVRWLLASNRAHFKKLKRDEMIPAMHTEFQYVLLSTPPERMQRFQELKAKYGSFHAFHGSPLYNWHAIMRHGLKNMSNTSRMSTGAAYGAGIYLAPDSATSFGYARSSRGWANSQYGNSSTVTCLALCEVIDHPDLKGMPNPYYVVKNEELILTRYFFIFSNGGGYSGSASVTAKSLSIPPFDLY